MTKKAGVEWVITQGHLLYSPKDVVAANKGKPPLTYQSFLGVGYRNGPSLEEPLTNINIFTWNRLFPSYHHHLNRSLHQNLCHSSQKTTCLGAHWT
jgi:hypothetical protein